MEKENKAIYSIYIGEHVLSVAKDACKWLTKLLNAKTTPDEFDIFWEKWCDGEEPEEIPEIPVKTIDAAQGEMYWEDVLQFEIDDFGDLYRKAFNNGATEFVAFDNEAYMYVVAICGKPSGEEIATLVLGSENVVDWNDEDSDESIIYIDN